MPWRWPAARQQSGAALAAEADNRQATASAARALEAIDQFPIAARPTFLAQRNDLGLAAAPRHVQLIGPPPRIGGHPFARYGPYQFETP